MERWKVDWWVVCLHQKDMGCQDIRLNYLVPTMHSTYCDPARRDLTDEIMRVMAGQPGQGRVLPAEEIRDFLGR